MESNGIFRQTGSLQRRKDSFDGETIRWHSSGCSFVIELKTLLDIAYTNCHRHWVNLWKQSSQWINRRIKKKKNVSSNCCNFQKLCFHKFSNNFYCINKKWRMSIFQLKHISTIQYTIYWYTAINYIITQYFYKITYSTYIRLKISCWKQLFRTKRNKNNAELQ